MKSKKFSKTLTLNKKTVADLNNGEMNGVFVKGVEESQTITGCHCFYTGCCITQVGETCITGGAPPNACFPC